MLYLYSLRSDEEWLRKQFDDQDQGDIPWETYKRLYEEGRIERITSLGQVPEAERGWVPYNSWELDSNSFCLDVATFFMDEDVLA